MWRTSREGRSEASSVPGQGEGVDRPLLLIAPQHSGDSMPHTMCGQSLSRNIRADPFLVWALPDSASELAPSDDGDDFGFDEDLGQSKTLEKKVSPALLRSVDDVYSPCGELLGLDVALTSSVTIALDLPPAAAVPGRFQAKESGRPPKSNGL